MKENNVIHIKFEYLEAIEAKKDILQTEISLLKIAKKINAYQELRKQELKTKIKFLSKLKGTQANIKKIQRNLPEIEIVKTIPASIKTPKSKITYDKDIENELRNIQAKLNTLQK